MRRVFEGGVGCWNGGMPERSIDIGDRDLDIGREEDGELSPDILKMNDNLLVWKST